LWNLNGVALADVFILGELARIWTAVVVRLKAVALSGVNLKGADKNAEVQT